MSTFSDANGSPWRYWLSTGLLGAALLASSISYFVHAPTISGVADLGFPDFFRVELGVLKLLAAVVLLVPGVPFALKEWAYAGSALFFLTAIAAHTAHGDPVGLALLSVLALLVLAVSRYELSR